MDKIELRREIISDLGRFTHDPFGFVMWAWPWGVAGGPLENETGPDDWQREELEAIGGSLRREPFDVVRRAIASGHGIGKSSLVAFVAHWSLMTFENSRGNITANTETQLRTKTWPEMAKWYGMLRFPLLREMFKLEATSFHIDLGGGIDERNWRIDAIPWSERNPEAFAGLHNAGNRILLMKDEASSVPDVIWEVEEGAMTDANTEMINLAFGNPTRNTGRFKEAIAGKFRNIWASRQIDSREVKRTNKQTLEEWRQAYGEDSDFFRVRVRGLFPRAASMQFIAEDIVDLAVSRPTVYQPSEPVIFGVDVARYGADSSILAVRQGLDARSIPWLKWQGADIQRDLMRVAGDIATHAKAYRPSAVFVDKGAMGAGLIDRLRQLGMDNVIPVDFGGTGGRVMVGQDLHIETSNQRTLMWASMREWLTEGAIPDDKALRADLTSIEYGYGADQVAMQLERKKDMKKRGLSSPDEGDALALTFAAPVFKKKHILPKPRFDPYADL